MGQSNFPDWLNPDALKLYAEEQAIRTKAQKAYEEQVKAYDEERERVVQQRVEENRKQAEEKQARRIMQMQLVQKGIIMGVIAVIGLIAFFSILKIDTVRGNEIAVLESWSEGVSSNLFFPKTYFLFPGFMKRLYHYDASSQVYVMNDKTAADGEKAEGRAMDAYTVQSAEGQDLIVSMNLRWRIDTTKIVDIHKTVRTDIEEKIIRPVLMRVVKDNATMCKAIDAYSGEGLVKLQKSIQDALGRSELASRGIIVENFVIERIDLDPNYINEIKAKQVATQRALRAAEEQKAAEATALTAQALAKADYNKQVVEAERDKQRGILEAEKMKQQEILAAEAEKQKRVLEAEGERDANLAKASGIVAVGEANAKAQTLQYTAFAAPGAERYVTIKVAEQLAIAYQNVKGFIPSDMRFTMFTEDYIKSMGELVSPEAAATIQQ